jgi:hypothetical protein
MAVAENRAGGLSHVRDTTLICRMKKNLQREQATLGSLVRPLSIYLGPQSLC